MTAIGAAVGGCGGGACTIGGAAGSKNGLLGKSSIVKPVTEALNRGFLMGVAPGRCDFEVESLIMFYTRTNTHKNKVSHMH